MFSLLSIRAKQKPGEGEGAGRAAMWKGGRLERNGIPSALRVPSSAQLAFLSKHICFMSDHEIDFFKSDAKFGNWNLKPGENYITVIYELSVTLCSNFHA